MFPDVLFNLFLFSVLCEFFCLLRSDDEHWRSRSGQCLFELCSVRWDLTFSLWQTISTCRTSWDSKLWLGRGHPAVRRTQNSIFWVRTTWKLSKWWQQYNAMKRRQNWQLFLRSMLLCGVSLLSISLVPEGHPTVILVIALFGKASSPIF